MLWSSLIECPPKVELILEEFKDMFLEDLSDELPPMRDLQHAIDLGPRVTLPNIPHYKMNPTGHAELKR